MGKRSVLLASFVAVVVALFLPMAPRFFQKVKDLATSGSSGSGTSNYQGAQSNSGSGITRMAQTGKVNVAYFTNWSIYGQKYHPSKVPCSSLTHILYAFADIKDDGTVFLTDAWSDVDIHYDGDSWEDQGKKLYGNFKQFALMKRQHRHLKLLLSIGGWTYSSHFKAVLTPAGRQRFVESAMKILEDVGLDGLDVDWEYPQNAGEAQAYVDLLAALRQALDQREQAMGEAKHWLSIAAPAGEARNKLKVREMDRYLDLWNLMAYDFTGTWSDTASHHANIFASPQAKTPMCADEAVSFFVNQGVNPAKIVLGMPLYSRAFANCHGLGSNYQGVPEGGSEPGLFFYKNLPLPGHQEYFDDKALAWYSVDPSGSQVVSYEGPTSVDAKADYIHRRGLAGAMWWELGGDAEDPQRALVPRAGFRLGNLDQSSNNLHFPGSQYENVRSGQI